MHFYKRLVLALAVSVVILLATPLFTTVNNLRVTGTGAPTVFPQQGSYLIWNHFGSGDTDYVNGFGGGTGGFYWFNVAPNAGFGSSLMGLSPAGTLTASAFSGHVLQTSYGHGAGCTTGSGSYVQCTATVNWTVGFADTSYAASCMIINPIGHPTLVGATKANGSVTVTIGNGTADGATISGGSLDCVASEN